MTAPATPRPEGFGREASLEAGRRLNRPADAHLDALDRRDDPRPERWIHFAPDLEDEG
jgi:hypothetical protein